MSTHKMVFEYQNYHENTMEKDQIISKNENLGLETENSEYKTEELSDGDHLEVLEKNSIDQIDLVSEINRLDIKQENEPVVNEDAPNFNINNEELKSIFDNKPDNKFTQSNPQSLLSRVSSFFGKDKANEIKLDPNLYLQKDEIVKKEFEKR